MIWSKRGMAPAAAALLALAAVSAQAAGGRPAAKPGARAAAAGARERVNATDGSAMVWVPGGEFTMGGKQGDPDEKPAHKATVEGFWLGKYEVTNEQYAKFLKATERRAPMFWEDEELNKPKQPVVGVKWLDAIAYCEWAGVRLPTEAEWEFASAAGAKQLAYGTATGELSHDLANYAGVEGKDKWDEATAPVGSFPPNPFGLYDLAGNAWEWCSSMWKEYPYKADDGREDMERYGFRLLRGGCWHFNDFHCRTACRHRHNEHLQFDYAGFRVAMSAAPAGETGAAAKPGKTAAAAKPVAAPREAPSDAVLESLHGLYQWIGSSKMSAAEKQDLLVTLNELSRKVKGESK